ncbi:hypothetical protein TWF506_008810 [Arthrobotrys conoides]|uniref:Uncharacterized protein n=1 Tax=Arthrobotrys conoides TaxID=74498 RepID=A0AAN8NJP4_9PEZI
MKKWPARGYKKKKGRRKKEARKAEGINPHESNLNRTTVVQSNPPTRPNKRQEGLGNTRDKMMSENGHGTLAYSRFIMAFPRNGEIGLAADLIEIDV